MNRRLFLQILVSSGLLPTQSLAYPLDRLLGSPGKTYVQAYIQRYWAWYNQTWAPLHEKMSAKERGLFSWWLTQVSHFGESWGENISIENFLTRHHLKKEQNFHSSYYVGLPRWPAQQREHILSLFPLKKAGQESQDFLQNPLFGWSRNFDGQTSKLWFKNPTPSHFLKNRDSKSPVLGFVEFLGSQEIRRGLVFHETKIPLTAHTHLDGKVLISAFRVEDSLGVLSWKLRTRSTFLLPLKKGIERISGKHQREFHQLPDLLDVGTVGADQLKVYYP